MIYQDETLNKAEAMICNCMLNTFLNVDWTNVQNITEFAHGCVLLLLLFNENLLLDPNALFVNKWRSNLMDINTIKLQLNTLEFYVSPKVKYL